MNLIEKFILKIKKELIFIKIRIQTRVKLGIRVSIIGPEFFSFGNNVSIGKYYKLHCFNEYAGVKLHTKLIIEDGAYIGDFFTINNADTIHIKKNALIASHVLLVTLNHGIDLAKGIPFMEQPLTTGPIVIGENCWIGENVTILSNVVIGNNCVIGANSVVTKSIPDNSVAVGIPARVVKKWSFETNTWEKIN